MADPSSSRAAPLRNKRIDRLLWRKSKAINAVLCGTNRYTELSARFREAILGTHSHDHNVAASVQVLLTSWQPTAILRKITLIIVSAFNGKALGHSPHVGKEILEDKPAITNRDTAATIVWVRTNMWIGASIPHVEPRSILSTALAATSVAVRLAAVMRVTSAAFRVAFNQVAISDYFFFPTIASAFAEDRTTRRPSGIFKNQKPRVSNANFADVFCHFVNIPCGVFLRQGKMQYG